MVGSDTDLIDTRSLKATAYMVLDSLPEETKQACYEAAKEHLSPYAIRELSYPTPPRIKPRPAMTEYGSADNDIAEAEIRATYRNEQLVATIAHKDEIMAGLQDEINFLKAREAATESAEKRALFERDKAIEALREQAKPDNSKGAQLAHAIGNAGESMSKQGLSLFDRYY